jgi:polyhydroxybutyrate depolymerase
MRLVVWLLVLGVPMVATADPAAAPARLAPGDQEIRLAHGGRERFYLVHAPPAAASGAALPVVLVFHGGGGTAEAQQEWAGMDRVADQEGFLAVYPAGTGRFERRLLTWNAGGCCGYASDHDVDDVGFVAALLDDLATRASVDPARVYATGLSNGGMLSYRLASDLAERIAAIATVGGARLAEPLRASRPVPVLHIHSVDDPRAPFAGGPGPRFPFLRRVMHPPVEDVIRQWVAHDGCPREPREAERREVAKGAPDAGHTATLLVYGPCTDGSEVALWRLTGAGHVWPGPGARYPERLLGAPTSVLVASEEVWRFFRRFALRRE